MRKFLAFLSATLLLTVPSAAQVTVSPAFPTVNEPITITYDASQGNGALLGISPIYAYTGLITTLSATPDDWMNVQGNFGVPDNKVLMTSIGNNKYTLSFTISSFYGTTAADTVLDLAFIFTNSDGSIVGRSADSDNIMVGVYNDSFHAAILLPTQQYISVTLDTTLNISAVANRSCNMQLYANGNLLSTTNGTSLTYTNFHFLNYGLSTIVLQATTTTDTIVDSLYALVHPAPRVQDPPTGTAQGINYLDDSTVILELLAPLKNYVYVIGDFTNWQIDTGYLMNVASDGQTFWLKISNLTPQKEYIFQYLVDGSIRIGDPYSDKVSDPNVDPNIPGDIYPGLISYPFGKTTGIASVLQTAQPAYPWQATDFVRPAKSNLNIYEMFIPTYVTNGTYAQAKDSLDYLVHLGINTVELMPIENFEGVVGWGYNPNYFCAPEKTYGPQDSLRSFIDACHSKGLAVLLDIPFNDAFETNPMVMMYWDTLYQRPAYNNPWFNQVATHPYSVGYDFNHESQVTKNFVQQVTRTWIHNYHIDGYRFDLTKGYTQFYSGTNVELWGEYDASRIAILEQMVDSIWAYDPNSLLVFEHLSENPEEIELSSHGILLWGDENPTTSQATMGYSNPSWDFSAVSWEYNGWSQSNQVSYMESHDEERLMYDNETYGDSITGYDIKAVDTGCARMEMAGTLFFTVPGPKMIYEFGELGYDYSINYNGREGFKPIKWNYRNNPYRLHLYKVWTALFGLRNKYPTTFQTSNYNINLSGSIKTLQLTGDFDAVAVGNFDETPMSAAPGFQHTGKWYDYFTGDSLDVTSTSQAYSYKEGEYHLYTDISLPVPDLNTNLTAAGITEITNPSHEVEVYPNPNMGVFNMVFSLGQTSRAELDVYDLNGQVIYSIHPMLGAGMQNILINLNTNNHLAAGMYLYRLTLGNDVYNGKISVVNN